MQTVRILHLADLHLGWQPLFLGEKAGERADERNGLLRRAAEFALDKRNRIDAVIIAGDLFETHNPQAALVDAAISALERLERAGKRVITVPGNHDEVTYHDSVYRREADRWPGILALNPHPAHIACFERDGRKTAFYGLAYTAGVTQTMPPLREFPRREADRHVGVFHGSLDWDAGDRSLPISGEAAAQSGYDCLALGHIHKHTVRRLKQVTACYAGAVEAKGFSDTGCGHFTVLDIGETVRVETADACCRPCRLHTIDLSSCERLEDALQRFRELADPRAISKVLLSGYAAFAVDAARLQEQFAHLFYHLDVESESVFLPDDLLDSLQDEPTIRGFFVRTMQERMKQAQADEEREILRRALFKGVAALRGGDS